MASIDCIGLCKGVPFVETSFDSSMLLGALAAKRAHLLQSSVETSDDMTSYLNPYKAVLMARKYYGQSASIDAKMISGRQYTLIESAIEFILKHRQDWQGLVRGPFLYFYLAEEGCYSLTNHLIPQCVFLGREAFHEIQNLPETIVHELSHVWCGLIDEVSPLTTGHNDTFTLPSGTSGKTTLATLLAAHFAGSALVFHTHLPNRNVQRIRYLFEYLKRTVITLGDARELTLQGRKLLSSLDRLRLFCEREVMN